MFKQIGDNGHEEIPWSQNIRENIVQLNYQLVRTSSPHILQYRLTQILTLLSNPLEDFGNKNSSLHAVSIYIGERNEMLIMLYKMIGYTRDIMEGKGEYQLTYMLILTWYSFFPECAKYSLKCCVEYPYGSWKDVKYFCEYCKTVTRMENHPLIEYAISLMNQQLKKDYDLFLLGYTNPLSLVAKWVPRENSNKFGWLFPKLSSDFYGKHKKANMNYRKICSALNRVLDTIQIKQCQHRWREIQKDRITSCTLIRQSKALLNLNSSSEDTDRIICAENMAVFNKKENKENSISIVELVKKILSTTTEIEKKIINSQWNDIKILEKKEKQTIGFMIPLLDMQLANSHDDAFYAAIGLACIIAENSQLGKRILAFGSGEPKWINLTDKCNLTDMIECIKTETKFSLGSSPNFYSALDFINDAIETSEEGKLTLVILSDMQMEKSSSSRGTLYKNIKDVYSGKEPPQILFWNLRCTNGFPAFYNDKNVSMMSGYSKTVLQHFLKSEDSNNYNFNLGTPWCKLKRALDNIRYKNMQDFIMENQKM